MNLYQSLYNKLNDFGLSQWCKLLEQQITQRLIDAPHGKMQLWTEALNTLPDISPSQVDLKEAVAIGHAADLSETRPEDFVELIKTFHPWRKGPYWLFDIHLNTEWRSDWKWQRVLPHLKPLQNKRILDVGGGNGYHGWRMLGEQASFVMVIDPTVVFTMQYQLINHFIKSDQMFVVPIGIEHLPQNLQWFDTIFSMGVLYHRRSPMDHLMELRACLKPKGELVLETLIIDGKQGELLVPEGRYAKMNNVWFIPSEETMLTWLRKCGFNNPRCVDVNVTSIEEQRVTDWMQFESLVDFLDPEDHNKTIEGYPAPVRAVFIAEAP